MKRTIDLQNILSLFYDYVREIYENKPDFFEALFGNIYSLNKYGLPAYYSLGKYISKKETRSLPNIITKFISSKEGFGILKNNVYQLLNKIDGRKLYEKLCKELNEDEFITITGKKQILYCCQGNDNKDTEKIAQFVTVIIVVANYCTRIWTSTKKNMKREYNFNISFLDFSKPTKVVLEEKIYIASHNMYKLYNSDGGRFSFSILYSLLPKGYIKLDQHQTMGKTNGTFELQCLENIIQNGKKNMLIIGEGGIGKTTFFYNLLKNEFRSKSLLKNSMIPIYVELNSCPPEIGNWYNIETHCTNFVFRYIGKMLYGCSYSNVPPDFLDQINGLFSSKNNTEPQFLILLDGFNEVSNDKVKNEGNVSDDTTIREQLGNEITKLLSYPNVRILLTSRPTQSVFFSDKMERVELVGVSKGDIKKHLNKNGFSELEINQIFSKNTLMNCLRVPLFLCMFSSNRYELDYMPLNQGEILYHFFHKKSVFYNEREHFSEYQTGSLSQQQMFFVLDFLLPYIGWVMEMQGLFNVNREKIEEYITDFFHMFPNLFLHTRTNPFENYFYQREDLEKIVLAIAPKESKIKIKFQDILDCLIHFLSILYERAEIKEESILYGFNHHYFRDYFAAMFDVQMLRMIHHIYMREEIFNEYEFKCLLNGHRWHDNKLRFIGQILNEHRNKPLLDENNIWYIPDPVYTEQIVLQDVLEFMRWRAKDDSAYPVWSILLKNIIDCIGLVRGELSGVDFSYLDLRGCCLYNVICSRVGLYNTIAARFIGAIMDINCFSPEGHTYGIQEYVYHGNQLFTIDPLGTIKIWDCITGKVLSTLNGGNPFGVDEFDYQVTGFLKVSNDGKSILTKNYPLKDNDEVSVVYSQLDNGVLTVHFTPDRKFSLISYIGFGHNDQEMLTVFDNKYLYIFQLKENEKREYFLEFARNSIYVYPALSEDTYYIITSDYIFQDDEEEEDKEKIMQCEVFQFNKSGYYECLLSFQTYCQPVIFLFDQNREFILFYDPFKQEIRKFLFRNKIIDTVISNLEETPMGIFQRPQRESEIYILYYDRIYIVDSDKLYSDTTTNCISYYNTDNKIIMDEVLPGQNRILLKDKLKQVYEFNFLTDQLNIKYPLEMTYINGLYKDKKSQFIICTDYYLRSICVYGGDFFKIKQTFLYNYPGYKLFLSAYSVEENIVALLLSNSEHEVVLLQNLITTRETVIYSDFPYNQEIVSVFFLQNQYKLIICTNKKLMYYNVETNTFNLVYEVLNDEKLIDAYGENEGIVVAAYKSIMTEDSPPYIYYFEYKLREKEFVCQYQQEILLLNNELIRYFAVMVEDQITEEENTQKVDLLDLRICKGCLLGDEEEIESNLKVTRYLKDKERKILINIKTNTVQYFCCRYNMLQCRSYTEEDLDVIHYLDKNEMIIVKGSNIIEEWELKESFKCKKRYVAKVEGEDVGWDYLLPISFDKMIGCHSANEICVIDRIKGIVLENIIYSPGLSISKCKFQNCVMEKEIRKIIINNGGEI